MEKGLSIVEQSKKIKTSFPSLLANSQFLRFFEGLVY